MWALTVSENSTATEEGGDGDFLKWDRLQGGDWQIPSSLQTEKKNKKLALLKTICVLALGGLGRLEHHIDIIPKDTGPVCILGNSRRINTAKPVTKN